MSAAALDSERHLVGCLYGLPDGAAVARAVSTGLQVLHFSDPLAAALFSAVVRHAERVPDLPPACDPDTFAHAGRKLGREIDTFELQALIDASPPTAEAVPVLARRVMADHARRLAFAATERALVDLRGGGDVQAAAAELRYATEALGRTGPQRSVAVSLVALADQPIEPGETLLGTGNCRWLERGAVALLVAPSGVGKSHIAAQAAVCWACGLPAFGLPPTNGPLRVMILQAENPPNDSRQIAHGMIEGLGLTNEERAMVDRNTRQIWLPGHTGDAFLATARSILAEWPADLLFIDPLAGFADGDLTRPEIVQRFCRAGLGRLAVESKCGLLVCHHVPKPNPNRDPSKLGVYDFQYIGAGSADLVANWPRAVLTLQTLTRGEFLLRAAKRRPPWRTEAGEQAWTMGLRHTDAGTWETFAPDPVSGRTGRSPAPDPHAHRAPVTQLFATGGPLPRGAAEQCVTAKVTGTRGSARAVLSLLLADGTLVTWRGRGRGGIAMIGLPGQAPKPEAAGTPPETLSGEVGRGGRRVVGGVPPSVLYGCIRGVCRYRPVLTARLVL